MTVSLLGLDHLLSAGEVPGIGLGATIPGIPSGVEQVYLRWHLCRQRVGSREFGWLAHSENEDYYAYS
jgi:hypothetical protein